MKTDLSPDTDVSLLPRADLPVIWDGFKAKAELVRDIAETLTVTCITQKEEMALARTTRLTLREIRIAVENKRVELGESHLKEIKKVNGAANAIKDFIQPLEARLLVQEEFGERAEAARIAELSKSRTAELLDLRRNFLFSGNIGALSQEEYDILLTNLRNEKAEIEAANRLRIEAERRLAEQQAEALRVAEVTRATLELAQRVALEVKQKADAEAQRVEKAIREEAAILMRVQQAEAQAEAEALELQRAAEHKAQREEYERKAEAARILAQQERDAAQWKAQQEQARLDAERAVRDADLAEQKRIRDEQYAVLEAELAQANAAKVAEQDRLARLALAPDIEQLRGFSKHLKEICKPVLKTAAAEECLNIASRHFAQAIFTLDTFCRE